jgi:hypothetical protein
MSNYYTLTPHQDKNGIDYGVWQPDSITNKNIHANNNIMSNWKYRQYMQNNANQIMKYNTMDAINGSGNNPYTVTNTEPTNKTPYLYGSIHNTSSPAYGFRNSDLKNDYMTKENLRFRMVSPNIPTNF